MTYFFQITLPSGIVASATFAEIWIWYCVAWPRLSAATGTREKPVMSPESSASPSPDFGETENRPREASSLATAADSLCSSATRGVEFRNVGNAIRLMFSGRKLPRPTSV